MLIVQRLGLALCLATFGVTYTYAQSDTIRVTCIGNSITEGYAYKDTLHNRYPTYLQQKLGAKYKVANCGESGATMLRNGNKPYFGTPEWRQAKASRPNVVIIKLGTNDSKPRNWDLHKDEFIGDMLALIDTVAALPTKPRILLATPVPAFENRFTISGFTIKHEIKPLLKKAARKRGLKTVDLDDLGKNPDFYTDGVHLTAEGARMLADLVAKAIRKSEAE